MEKDKMQTVCGWVELNCFLSKPPKTSYGKLVNSKSYPSKHIPQITGFLSKLSQEKVSKRVMTFKLKLPLFTLPRLCHLNKFWLLLFVG